MLASLVSSIIKEILVHVGSWVGASMRHRAFFRGEPLMQTLYLDLKKDIL